MEKYTLEDWNKKILLVISDDGQYAFSRYPDMTEETKKELIEMYESLSGKPADAFRRFLDFKSEDFQFCS